MPKKKSTVIKLAKNRVAELNIALQNLVESKATLSEINLLKQSLQRGEIVIGGNANNSILISGTNNVVQLSPDALGVLSEREGASLRRPLQLPPLPTHTFVGRQKELLLITHKISANNEPNHIIITGAAGVGKTTLAINAANGVEEFFTDGVLFIDFRGRSEAPLNSSEAMRYILSSLRQESFAALRNDELLGFYRAFLKNKRILLIFDNVDRESQIESLLLPLPSQAIIISRQNLYIEGSHQLNLNTFTQVEALQFLTNNLNKISFSTEDALALASACGYYPLALQYAVSTMQNLALSP